MSSALQRWSRLAGALFLALGLLGLWGLLMPRVLGAAAGPEAEIISLLKETEREGLELPIAGSAVPLTSREHHFARIIVRLAPGGQRAEALATLDFTGSLGDTQVSSLGVEQVPFVREAGEWKPERTAAPRLVAAISALEARRKALETGHRQALVALLAPRSEKGREEGREEGMGESVGAQVEAVLAVRARRYQAQAWYLRLERDEAAVAEHWRLEGSLPQRPVDEKGQRQLSLVLSGEQFLFSAGLM